MPVKQGSPKKYDWHLSRTLCYHEFLSEGVEYSKGKYQKEVRKMAISWREAAETCVRTWIGVVRIEIDGISLD